MDFPNNFIGASHHYNELDKHVPAPFIRRSFNLEEKPEYADLIIGTAGFYELYINGERITKGALSPFISNPDDMIYFDCYEIASLLSKGENVIGVVLGNGFQNNPGGYVWDFDKAIWRGAPRFALKVNMKNPDGTEIILESDESFCWLSSPIIFDDLRVGEEYDARLEVEGWNCRGFNEIGWNRTVCLESPRGEKRICEAPPIVVTHTTSPIKITELEDGFLYDFGLNQSGVTRLELFGDEGQEIILYHGEHLKNGQLDMAPMACDLGGINQRNRYICKSGFQIWQPTFTYHGFQYVFVKGLKKEQATKASLTCMVMNTDLKEVGGFRCSDQVLNQLQEMTRRSTLGNFHHIPTDCPHREKNGWTADAALSAEHTLLNLDASASYREWMRNICKAQADDGSLPGIVPTGGWGFAWGNGPAWDCVLVYLPYFSYIYRGDIQILQESAPSILRYISYLTTKVDSNGLLSLGLGDWCNAGRVSHDYKSPLEFTTTVISMDICAKAAYLFTELNLSFQKDFALSFYEKLKKAARDNLIDKNSMIALGHCQTSQAMAIYYNLFEQSEKPKAFERLVEIIRESKNKIDCGVLGARVIFHVLAEFGETELAINMIKGPEFPSYGWWIEMGATTLWEDFLPITNNPQPGFEAHSRNHHFWGDISHFFIRQIAGINYNSSQNGARIELKPNFPTSLNFAEAFHKAVEGDIFIRWERTKDDKIILTLETPETLTGKIILPTGFVFENRAVFNPAISGKYCVVKL